MYPISEDRMASIDLEHARTTLTAERERLVHQLGELGADEAGELTGDMDYGDAFADAAAATSERTRTIGLVDNLKASVNEIDTALGKIDDGTYGVCVDCGTDIDPERLEFRPNSVKCVTCKTAKP